MFRVLLVLAWLAVTVFAIADWARTPEEEMPGRIPRMMWLIILLLTIPSFSIGSIVWLIVRAVARSEAAQRGEATPGPGIFPRFPRRTDPTPSAPPAPLAPDDDPEFLFKLERDIRRRRADEARRQDAGGPADPSEDAEGSAPADGDGSDTPHTDEGGTGNSDSPGTPRPGSGD